MSQGRRFPLPGLLILLLAASPDLAFPETPAVPSATPAGNPRQSMKVLSRQPAGENTITDLIATLRSGGAGDDWYIDFNYSFTGQPSTANIEIELIGTPTDPSETSRFHQGWVHPLPGSYHWTMPIRHPGGLQVTQLAITMYSQPSSGVKLASQSIPLIINFPSTQTDAISPEAAALAAEKDLQEAARLLDYGATSDVTNARHILERLIESNPRFTQAYVELARVAMKMNWSPEGLHQAENLLDSALRIQPDSANAKILLGYVYVQQKRFPQAASLFAQAAKSDTNNTWLWVNWGELLILEGKPDQAILKYREVIQRSMRSDTYDRARLDAYSHLVALLRDRNDLDGMEALYKQRIQDFGSGSCYSAEYSLFMLNVRGDAQGAIDLTRRALKQNCDDSESRSILGLASYVKWATAEGAQSTAALNQARIFMPAGPTAFYRLASSDHTVPALEKLLTTGESLDVKDNQGMTALALAVEEHDAAAIKRLLTLGARADIPVGYGDTPLALLPVIEGEVETVRMLQQAGVDYSSIRYHGATAFDIAKQMGDDALLRVLGRKDHAL